MNQANFSSLNLPHALLKNLESLGYQHMTAIQAESLPTILQNQDVIAQAKTGSGKTAAFALGLLSKIKTEVFKPQALVICPTRELADQVAKEIRRLARMIPNIKVLTLCGGLPFPPQISSLAHGAHIIVGTPGRIDSHLHKERLSLENISTVVLDEADRMLEMGFEESINSIFSFIPKQRQTLLFSATYPDSIQSMAANIMHKPVMIKAASTHDTQTIQQHFYQVSGNDERPEAVENILLTYPSESTVIFCNTKREVNELADYLYDGGFSVLALHGDLEQRMRDQTLVRFANKSVAVLIATDVAARGLDIDKLDLVINYHISRDPEVHVHRIGRTGRKQETGIACSLVSTKEQYKVEQLEDYLEQKITTEALPKPSHNKPLEPHMTTLQIDGGKKQKVRAGDILGALTNKTGIEGKQIGKIHIFDNCAYVAVEYKLARKALDKLNKGKLKGRSFRARWLRQL